ncbi:restriction endonuclease subunit S [Paracoccus stylophorae]|uniref:Restriction endonuclease subunit S n=1 Tax=Paracoccus stylophorae TaxID=659350 RepID=A0ABY7SYD3_9RHOB|nr:restriction endonuclease subunit S [Paracoccus stylophorae]WCR12062.1 restriction endonuclease subunit S [Paracoccus stylophorae]
MRDKSVPLSEVLRLDIDAVDIDATTTYEMSGVYGFGRGLFHREPLRGSETTYKRFHQLSVGQVVLSQLKGWEGAIAVVDPENSGRFLSTQFPTFRCDEERAIIAYVGWFLKYAPNWHALRRKSRGMGARRDTISPEKFLSLEIPLPSLDDQRRIVEKLDRVAALVDERRNAIEEAERETQALLLKAFQRAIDGAPLRPMAEVAPLVRRPVEIDLDASYPELGVRSFGRGTFHKPDLLGADLSWQKLFLVQQGDLVFSNIKAWEGAFAVAGPDDHGRVGSHRYLTCVPTQGLATADFIWFYLQTSEGLGKVQSASPGSADRNRTLGQGALEAITVPTPPIGRQQWFDRLHAKAHEARTIRANTAQDVEALIPAMLHETFGRQHQAA